MRRVLPFILLAVTQVAWSQAVAQAASPPFSCADTIRAALGAFDGVWHVRALFRTGPGTWDTTEATSTFAPDLAGCVLRQDYRGTRYGEPYAYLALWGANGLPGGRIQRFFAHSQHGILDLAAGMFYADTLTLESRPVVQGRPLIQQVRITRPVAGVFSQADRRSTDGGTTWTVTLQATYRRDTP